MRSPELISGATRLAGVIGDPVRHSLSPAIPNAAYAAHGLDWAYVALPVRPGGVEAALRGAVALGLEGLSVTMPHKATAAACCDELTPAAVSLGVVNATKRVGTSLVGHNTDGTGFLHALSAAGWDAAGRNAIVLGAGGTARALTAALAGAGAARVTVAARRADAAREVAQLAGAVGVGVALDRVDDAGWGGADLVANTTPVGMIGGPAPQHALAQVELLSPRCWVIDAVYHPTETPLLVAAKGRGLSTLGGVELLVGVSAEVFTWWTDLDAPLDAMSAAALDQLGRER